MTELISDEQLLVRYLVGALPAEEAERLDELSLADDRTAERLRAVENDLVDAYVRGELAGETRERFIAHYLSSPRRREKVTFAKSFLALTDAAVGKTAGVKAVPAAMSANERDPSRAPSEGRFSWLKFFSAPRPWLQWGLAATALLFLLAGGYFLTENARLKRQVSQAQAERAVLEQREQELQGRLNEQQTSDAETAKELARVRDRLAQLEQQLATAPPADDKPVPEGRDPQVAALTLLPQTRGGGQIPQVKVLAATDYVDLKLELEANSFPLYQAALKDPRTGKVLWQSGALKAEKSGALPVRLRARSLKPQNYTLEVSGLPAGGAAEIISSYTFKVVTR